MSQQPEETPASPRRPAPGEFYTYWGRRDLVAVFLFTATLVAAAAAWERLPTALAMLAAGALGDVTVGLQLQFFLAFAALVAAPIAGWALWWYGRNRLALATLALMLLAIWMLRPA